MIARLVLLVGILAVAACSSSRQTAEMPQQRGGDARLAGSVGHYKLGSPYVINGRRYYPEFDPSYDRIGTASWYGAAFHGKPTANGEVFNKELVTAAHPTLPLPSRVRVTNLENGRVVELRVNDRGPFIGDRMIDLSEAAARELGFREQGLARVRVQFLELAEARGTPPAPTAAVAARPPTAVPPRSRTPSEPADPAVILASLPANPPSDSACTVAQVVQLGAFLDAPRARAAAAQARAYGPVQLEPVLVAGQAALRVRAGPFPAGPPTDHVLGRLRASGYRDAFIVGQSQSSPIAC